LNILLVEDDQMLSMVLTDHLREKGHTVRQAHDGREALEFSKGILFDLFIVDLILPKLDGIALLETVRESGQNCKVIVISGFSELLTKEAQTFEALDTLAVIEKPFSFSEVDQALERCAA